MKNYTDFLESKSQLHGSFGFKPNWMPDSLFDFQKHLVDWDVRRGRAAVLADCGLGKSFMQLVKAQNIVRHTNGRVLILTPLAVAPQFVSEGQKFGVEVRHSRDGKVKGSGVYVTNYQRLHLFDKNDFVGLLGDESGCLKDEEGVTKANVTEFMRTLPYRGLYSATAAPNDYDELGTHSEALGEMGYQDMLTMFFKKTTKKDYLGWGRAAYKLRKYAEKRYWQWVCSWARSCRKPSDLGFSDEKFNLPPLEVREHRVETRNSPNDSLFDWELISLQEQQEERRRTVPERCEMAASLVRDTKQSAICWCFLNAEGDLLEKLIPGSVQVSGSDSDEKKEEKVSAFVSGQARVLVSKPSIAGFGLNFQHCAHQTYFPSHSFEAWYQGVRRSWRFGQKRSVVIDVITTDGASAVMANLKRKQAQAEEMFSQIVALMNESLSIHGVEYGSKDVEVPSWMSSIKS